MTDSTTRPPTAPIPQLQQAERIAEIVADTASEFAGLSIGRVRIVLEERLTRAGLTVNAADVDAYVRLIVRTCPRN